MFYRFHLPLVIFNFCLLIILSILFPVVLVRLSLCHPPLNLCHKLGRFQFSFPFWNYSSYFYFMYVVFFTFFPFSRLSEAFSIVNYNLKKMHWFGTTKSQLFLFNLLFMYASFPDRHIDHRKRRMSDSWTVLPRNPSVLSLDDAMESFRGIFDYVSS